MLRTDYDVWWCSYCNREWTVPAFALSVRTFKKLAGALLLAEAGEEGPDATTQNDGPRSLIVSPR